MFKRIIVVTGRYLVSLLILVGLWKLLIVVFDIPKYLLPTPESVLSTIWSEWPMYLGAARATVSNMLFGAFVGIGLGALTGMFIAYSPVSRWIVEPYLMMFQSFPRESLFPLLVVWLGFGSAPKIVNAALLSFFPIAVVTLNGLLDTRHEYIGLMRSWGATRAEEFFYCRLPALVPTLIGAVKVALPLALIGAVLGEFMGGNEGLGYIIISSGSAFRVDRIFGAIVILALVGVGLLALIQLFQNLFLQRFNQE